MKQGRKRPAGRKAHKQEGHRPTEAVQPQGQAQRPAGHENARRAETLRTAQHHAPPRRVEEAVAQSQKNGLPQDARPAQAARRKQKRRHPKGRGDVTGPAVQPPAHRPLPAKGNEVVEAEIKQDRFQPGLGPGIAGQVGRADAVHREVQQRGQPKESMA